MRGIIDRLGAVRLPIVAAAVLTLSIASASAQVVEQPQTWDNLNEQWPCNNGLTNRIARVMDADSTSDIGGGGGSTQVWVQCDGVDTWSIVSIGGGGVDLSAYALLAGDADGQTIQGRTGANAARVDIGETDANQAALIGGGATHGFFYAYTDGLYGESPDGLTLLDIYNGGMDLTTDGASRFSGSTSTNLGSTAGWTAIGGSRVNVISLQTPPTNANDPCTAGDTIDTATFHYYCAATDTWVRVAMATW